MPTTLAAVLIFVFAVVPGVPGDRFYRTIVGADRREEQWHRAVRILAISTVGLALYSFLAPAIKAPMPSYLLASTFQEPLGPGRWSQLAVAFSGHLVAATAVGLAAAVVTRKLDAWTGRTPFPDAWDEFVRTFVPDHWVVVRLENGETYAGILKKADISVQEDERDLVLAEPAKRDEETGRYVTLSYQHLFLSGRLVTSVAIVQDPRLDTRITTVGENLFEGDPNG